MKLSIFEMQALEYALNTNGYNLMPIYQDSFGKIFKGHFLNKDSKDNSYVWYFNSQLELKKKSLNYNVAKPNLFNWYKALFEPNFDSEKNIFTVFEKLNSSFDKINSLKKKNNAHAINVDSMDLYSFQESSLFFDYLSSDNTLPVINLSEASYELISFEEIALDNA